MLRRELLALPGLALLPRFAIAQSDQRPSITIAVQKIVNSNTLEVLREQSNVGERIFFTSLWEGLLGRNWLGNLETMPGLASEWRRIDDRTVELSLRRGVIFHNGDEMTAEHDGFGGEVCELEGAGGRLQSVDTEVGFGRGERGPAVGIGAHDGSEFGDRRRGEPPRETANARIGKRRLAVMVGEVIDDEGGDGRFEFAQGTDAPEKRLGKRATCRLVSGARPPERAMFFLAAGRAGLAEIVCEHSEH